MRATNHAGICRLFDVMQTPSHIYLVLEKGDRDLYALIDDYPGGCPETVVKSATRVLVLALRHCHNAKIAHRDIKPENVLVCGDPQTWHQNPDETALLNYATLGCVRTFPRTGGSCRTLLEVRASSRPSCCSDRRTTAPGRTCSAWARSWWS